MAACRTLDNIFTERLIALAASPEWRTVKYEQVNVYEYASPREACVGLTRYFESYCHERPDQALNDQTPAQVYFRREKPLSCTRSNLHLDIGVHLTWR